MREAIGRGAEGLLHVFHSAGNVDGVGNQRSELLRCCSNGGRHHKCTGTGKGGVELRAGPVGQAYGLVEPCFQAGKAGLNVNG